MQIHWKISNKANHMYVWFSRPLKRYSGTNRINSLSIEHRGITFCSFQDELILTNVLTYSTVASLPATILFSDEHLIHNG